MGDGTFQVRGLISNLGCNGRYLDTGDFNRDGKGDLVAYCDSTIEVGISRGNATYQKTFEVNGQGITFLSNAIADLNGDGFADLVFAGNRLSLGSRDLVVYPGAADGRFGSEIVLPGVGFGNSYLIASDLDSDGHSDLISADSSTSSLTVIWGQPGERFLGVGNSLTGFSAATALEVGDLDRDGRPDLFLSISTKPEIEVYLGPGLTGGSSPSLSIQTAGSFSSVQVADLDGDGGPDLAGTNRTGGKVLAALLDATGRPREQVERPAGLFPWSILVARLDDGGTPDLAAPASGSGSIEVVPGAGGGSFADGFSVPTIEKPRKLAAATSTATGGWTWRRCRPARWRSTGASWSHPLWRGRHGDGLPEPGEAGLRASGAVVFAGGIGAREEASFVRGGDDGDGRIEISDPIRVLGRLFLGDPPISCEAAADANDDGEIDLTDVLVILGRLFLGGDPLPPPGPEACGADPTADALPPCASRC
jgi:hypothetical protein